MNFKKFIVDGEPFYFSGIYKISRYEYMQGAKVKPYYHAYYLPLGNKNWGDFVGGKSAQQNKMLTLKQCKELCEEHAKEYIPATKQIKQAIVARSKWIN